MQKPQPPDPERFPPDMIDLPGWRPTDAIVAILFVVLGIVAIATLCGSFARFRVGISDSHNCPDSTDTVSRSLAFLIRFSASSHGPLLSPGRCAATAQS